MPFLVLILLGIIGGTAFFYGNLPTAHAKLNPIEGPPILKAKSVTGDARYKGIHELEWHNIKEGTVLRSEHHVVTGENSEVELEFIDDGALLQIPENTFMPFDTKFLVSSKLRRVFFLETKGSAPLSDLVKKHADPTYARVHWVLKGQPEVQREFVPENDNDLALKKESKLLTRIAPKGDVSLLVTSFPVYVSVSFLNPDPENLRIHGYLWNEELGSDPVWEGETDSYFAGIPITRKGSFVFQAFSDNDVYISLPLRIFAQHLED